MFKYLDLVKVVKPEPPPGAVVILNTDGANDAMAFYTGAVGRVIAKVNGGYKVWFPVPCFPDNGQAVDFTEKCLKLFHGATEKDYRAAHYPGLSATLPMPPIEVHKSEPSIPHRPLKILKADEKGGTAAEAWQGA